MGIQRLVAAALWGSAMALSAEAALAQVPPDAPAPPAPPPTVQPAPGPGAAPAIPSTGAPPAAPEQAPPAAEPPPPPPPAPAPPPPPPSTLAAPPPVALGPTVAPEAAPPQPIMPADGYPLAGCHNGLCYLRDAADNFRLFLNGSLHIDSNNYFGPGVSDSALKSTINLRRARIMLSGEFLRSFQFVLIHEIGATAFDNQNGTRQDYAAPVGVDPSDTTARYATVQSAKTTSRLQDAYINYRADGLFNVQMGQFKVPFTMENRSSSNGTSFLEEALVVRNLATPNPRDLGAMVWGNVDKNLFYYSAGVFLGDGANRPNTDNRFDAAARVYTRPLARSSGPLKGLHVGASGYMGSRNQSAVAYDMWSMKSMGGYTFWSPTYTDSVKSADTGKGRLEHVIPSGNQRGAAFELWLPLDRLDLRGELVYARYGTREAVDGRQLTNTERAGTLTGTGYYAQVGYCVWGKPGMSGEPGADAPKRLDLTKPPKAEVAAAVDLVVRWEQLRLDYRSASRGGEADASSMDGYIKVNALSLGANTWIGKNVRLTLDYVYNMFPDSAPKSASSSGGPTWTEDQRALAPGNQLPKGIDDEARDSAHSLHELALRVGMQF